MTDTRNLSPPPDGDERSADRHAERGASLVEYAMMVALIAFVCITAVSFFGSENAGSITSSADSIVGN